MSMSLTREVSIPSGWNSLKISAAARWRSGAEGAVKLNTAGPVRATAIPCCVGFVSQSEWDGEESTYGDNGVVDNVSGVLVARLGVVQPGDGVRHAVAKMHTRVAESWQRGRQF